MKINKTVLKRLNASKDLQDWYSKKGSPDLHQTLLRLDEDFPLQTYWLYTRLFSLKMWRKFLLIVASRALKDFEAKHMSDERPRLAIKAATAALKRPLQAARLKARHAAKEAALAAFTTREADAYTAAYLANAAAALVADEVALPDANSAMLALYATINGAPERAVLISEAVKLIDTSGYSPMVQTRRR